MQNLDELPNEVLYYMCEQMQMPQLLTLTESYKRAYIVCQKVIEKKKVPYLMQKLQEGHTLFFDKIELVRDRNVSHKIYLYLDEFNMIYAREIAFLYDPNMHEETVKSYLKLTDWILGSEIYFDEDTEGLYAEKTLETKDLNEIQRILNKALSQGFTVQIRPY